MTGTTKPAAKPKPSIIDRILGVLETTIRRWRDDVEFTGARLTAIEERLAKLDYGYASDEAKTAALFTVNEARRTAGSKPLSFRLANGKREWNEE